MPAKQRKCKLPACGKKFTLSQRHQKYCCRLHQRKGSMRRWQKRNRKKVRTYNAAWRADNPEKVKAQKKRAAPKYKIRRRMLYETRSPERIKQDNAKALKAYHRRYPNRSPEQVEKDTERRRERYQLEREAIKELAELHSRVEQGKAAAARLEELEKAPGPVLIGDGRMVMKKPGPKIDLVRAAFAHDLHVVKRLQWDPVVERVEARFRTKTNAKALRELLRRYGKYLALQEKATG
jgi:hypothetical protein